MKAIITIILKDDGTVRVISDGSPRDLGGMLDTAVHLDPNIRASVIVAAALMIKDKSQSVYRSFMSLLGMPVSEMPPPKKHTTNANAKREISRELAGDFPTGAR